MRLPSRSILLGILLCAGLAGLSAVLLPTVPSYDPWAWVEWGREVVDPHLSFATGGGPSWKPFPVLFTAVLGLFGGAAPALWVLTARVGGLLALVAAWRLGSRLAAGYGAQRGETPAGGHRHRTIAAPIAGLVAVLGVILTQDYFYYMFRGTSEPMLVAASLWAVERVLAARHAQAFSIGLAASLIRPEAWPFLGAYGLWLWIKQPQLRLLILAGAAAVPVFWFVPTWIGSGQPFLAASHAKAYNGHLGSHPVLEALRRSADLQVPPVLIGALGALVLAWRKKLDRLVLSLAAGALAWIALVLVMVLAGYPGLERFFLPASAVICVLAGVGVARLAMLGGDWIASAVSRAPASERGARAATLALTATFIAISVPLSIARIDSAGAQKSLADRAVRTLDQLTAAVKAVGGHAGVYPCRASFSATNHAAQTALAWKLHVTLGRVGTALRKPGVDFIGPHNSTNGSPAPVSSRLTGMELLAQAGVWRVVRVTLPGHSNACVGR